MKARWSIGSWLAALAAAASLCNAAAARETLGPGDTVRITVFQSPELAAELRVSERGSIVYPLIGEVAVSGLSTEDAATQIAERLRMGRLVSNPQVTVTLLQLRSRQVSVLGHVVRPGRYALDAPHVRLTDVLAQAGGVDPVGGGTVTLLVTQDGKTRRREIDLAAMARLGDLADDVELNNGDVVFVERAPVFYIYGEVQRPGAQRLDPGVTVMQALSLGGGLTPRGTQRGLRIHRKGPDGSLRAIEVRPGDTVQANDVVYVRERLF